MLGVKGLGKFGTAVCVQKNRQIVYIVSLSTALADPNSFLGIGSCNLFLLYFLVGILFNYFLSFFPKSTEIY